LGWREKSADEEFASLTDSATNLGSIGFLLKYEAKILIHWT
jgi:hypothetical protein